MDNPGNHAGMDVCDQCGDYHPTRELIDLDQERYCEDCAVDLGHDEALQHAIMPYLDPALFPDLVLDEAGVPIDQH
jgi:hypothetical protein